MYQVKIQESVVKQLGKMDKQIQRTLTAYFDPEEKKDYLLLIRNLKGSSLLISLNDSPMTLKTGAMIIKL